MKDKKLNIIASKKWVKKDFARLFILLPIAYFIITSIIKMFIPYDLCIYYSNPDLLIGGTFYCKVNTDTGLYKKSKEKPGNYMDYVMYDRSPDEDFSYIKNFDPEMFYRFPSDTMAVGDYVYYYRHDDNKNIYKYNKHSNEIASVPIFDEVLNPNSFSIIENIAYFDYYVGLKKCVDEIRDNMYNSNGNYQPQNIPTVSQIYSVNDRVFFIYNSKLYEFDVIKQKANYIMRIKYNPLEIGCI